MKSVVAPLSNVKLPFPVTSHRSQEQTGDKFDCGPKERPRAVEEGKRCEPLRQVQEDEVTAKVSENGPTGFHLQMQHSYKICRMNQDSGSI